MLAAGGQTLHSPVLARSNYHQVFKIRAGVQNLRSPVWGYSNNDEVAAYDLHNSIRVAQNSLRRNSHAQTKLGDMPSLNNCVRLTYGHLNPLKMFQDGNSRLAQNIPNLLNLRNYRVTRELANSLIISTSTDGGCWSNSLNRFDYNESLESANWLLWSSSVELTELDNLLIISRNANGESWVQSVYGQNNVKRGLEVPTNFFSSCNGSAFLLYEENQQRTVLCRNPDLAYERVVTQSYEVNRVSLRGLVRNLQVTKSYSPNAKQPSMLLTTNSSRLALSGLLNFFDLH